MKKKNKKTPGKITVLEQLKLMRGRVMIPFTPKVQEINKKVYKRDRNKAWKKDIIV